MAKEGSQDQNRVCRNSVRKRRRGEGMEAQGRLFELLPEQPWQADDQRRPLARVVFADWEGEFDYLIPDSLRQQVEPGRRLWVPFGRRRKPVIGYCVAVDHRLPPPDKKLKAVAGVADQQPLFTGSMLQTARWLAEYYLCSWGQALEAAVPSGVRSQAGTRLTLVVGLKPGLLDQLAELRLSPQQRAVLDCLASAGEAMTIRELARRAGCSTAPIQQLRKRGLLVSSRVRRLSHPTPPTLAVERTAPPPLTDEQLQAREAIRQAVEQERPDVFLLHGVTGSGKTEVYIHVIEQAVALGKQAIVLVPEVSLTPQTEERFRSRFSRVAVLHSYQSDPERHGYWREIYEGRVDVVVGPRSAVFAPVPRLGLVVIDEEHDASFKQEITPRYHAREVARYRCRLEKAPLILGSATPSLESYWRAQQGEYQLLRLTRRIEGRPMPPVRLIDMRDPSHRSVSAGSVSRPLHQAIHQALAEKHQVILLLNRRGYATVIQCMACGHVVRCPQCDIPLTHHRVDVQAKCHYCGHEQPLPENCPGCRSETIRLLGRGTQRLEVELQARFPQAVCVRMDSDAMRKPGAHAAALAKFRDGSAHILLGTQMIAKGLDFPNVTVVGVIHADAALHWPDFRSAERTFQLVTQVAGRTGRGPAGGRVYVQTYTPEHPALLAAAHHDYESFARSELAARRRFGYPPFGQMIRVVVRGPVAEEAEKFAETLGNFLRQQWPTTDARLLGPAVAPMAKLQGKYRFHLLLLTCENLDPLRRLLREARRTLNPPDQVHWIADVEPLDML
ncbi:MAG: primosomal protein N' [Pirellulaceae bacterium]|nr:MAG: primosomal protein N' [Pirellulaceae bacterium]